VGPTRGVAAAAQPLAHVMREGSGGGGGARHPSWAAKWAQSGGGGFVELGRTGGGEAGRARGKPVQGGKREFPLSNSYLALNSTPKYFSQITQP
jgi:hypothetical protein